MKKELHNTKITVRLRKSAPYFTSVEKSLGGKKTALFGSYGWGDGQWMRDWAERTKASGAVLIDDGFMQHEAPDTNECEEFGRKFAEF